MSEGYVLPELAMAAEEDSRCLCLFGVCFCSHGQDQNLTLRESISRCVGSLWGDAESNSASSQSDTGWCWFAPPARLPLPPVGHPHNLRRATGCFAAAWATKVPFSAAAAWRARWVASLCETFSWLFAFSFLERPATIAQKSLRLRGTKLTLPEMCATLVPQMAAGRSLCVGSPRAADPSRDPGIDLKWGKVRRCVV